MSDSSLTVLLWSKLRHIRILYRLRRRNDEVQLQLTCWLRSIVYVVTCASLRGGPPPVLYQQFEAADMVIVGKAMATHRIWNFFSSPKTHPRAAIYYEPTYTCEITIEVGAVIKAQASEWKPGAKMSVIWYLPTPDCAPKFGVNYDVFNRQALWLLRKENGILRVLVDNYFTAYPIENFSPDIQRGLANWSDPRSALTYLAVKPGVLVPEFRYPGSFLPINVIPLVGMTEYLKVFRTVYLESTDAQRGLISLEVSSLGYCQKDAQRIAQSDDRIRRLGSAISFYLDPGSERGMEETELADMAAWRNKDEVVEHFGDSKKAEDTLVQYSCQSSTQVKTRARQLLSKYFSIDPSSIPCIPCK
jgi:hypothetical protein